jgi:streptogramin lyase
MAAALAGAACLAAAGAARAQPQSISIQEFTIPTPGSQPVVITQSGGNLYFTESGTDKVGRSTPAGTIIDVATRAILSALDGISGDASGNLWITESSATTSHIIKASPDLTSMTHGGVGPPCTSPDTRPRGIALGPDGRMWVVLLECNKVLAFPPAFGPNGGNLYDVPTAQAGLARIASGPDGALWFTELAANKIGRITTAGSITEYPVPTAASEPHGITAGPDGAVWFTEFAANKIGRIATDGTITEYPIPTAGSGPREIVAGPDGALWFTQFNANKIGRISTTGAVTEYPVPTAASGPNGISNGPGNTVWFTEFNGNKIGRFLVRPVRGDFNRDGKADVFWRNGASGENYVYPMNGTAILPTEGYVRTVADLDWQVAGIGDFDGDGRADLLWRNASTGENYMYFMSGNTIVGEGYVRTVADLNWRTAGIGDFDGDGYDDILWRNASTGENYMYFMNGLSIVNEGYLRTVSDLAWQIAGVGDFNGDGKADILWRNASTGENYIYLMQASNIAGEGYLRTVADTLWQVKGLGDFDGDGKADIVWRHASSGENYLYPMDALAIKAAEGYLRAVSDLAWQIVATGDYDGDGKSDLLWRNSSTGDNYLYPMDGKAIKATEGYLRSVADPQWRIASGRGQGAPRRADVVIALDTSGSMQVEAGFVQAQLNSFASSIKAAGIDLNVVLIADPAAICIPAPLGSGACPTDENLPGYRHVAQTVQSTDALQRILDTHGAWSGSLRPGSRKVFLVVSDDDSSISANTFHAQLLALDPSLAGYRFDSIVATVTPGIPIISPNICTGLADSRGTEYINLSTQTGGIVANLCEQNFAPAFANMAAALIASLP